MATPKKAAPVKKAAAPKATPAQRAEARKRRKHQPVLDAIGPAPVKHDPTVLEEAQGLIYGQRMKDYGNAKKNFGDIAIGWSTIVGAEVSPEQVALMMTWLKVCRANTGLKAGNGVHRDSAVDIAGYAGCLEKIQNGL